MDFLLLSLVAVRLEMSVGVGGMDGRIFVNSLVSFCGKLEERAPYIFPTVSGFGVETQFSFSLLSVFPLLNILKGEFETLLLAMFLFLYTDNCSFT